MNTMRTVLFGLLPAALTAQTFVVDAANGPGTNYTSIAAAVAAVPDGAVLLVRPGLYAEFSIQGKGLTVLGGPGVEVTQTFVLPAGIEVTFTGAHQAVVVQGIRLVACDASASIRYCAGSVLLEDIEVGPPCPALYTRPPTFGVWQSSQVMLRNCTGVESWCSDSDVVLESCSLRGNNAYYLHGGGSAAGPALAVTGGTTQIVDCDLIGGSGNYSAITLPNAPGLQLTGADARVLAPTTITAGNNQFLPDAHAIDGTGNLRRDPGVVLITSVAPIAATISTVTAPMPAVLGHSASPGGALIGDAPGPIGNTVILVVAFPGPRFSVPGIVDPFWLDPAVYAFAAIGTPQPGLPVTSSVAVPNNQGFLGLRIGWQSVAVGTAGLEASNPSVSLVR